MGGAATEGEGAMLQFWMDWLERLLAGEGGGRSRGLQSGTSCPLRVCFDGRGGEAGGPPAGAFDLVVAPAAWHWRGDMLLLLCQLLGRCGADAAGAVELLVLHDGSDQRLAQTCAALLARRRPGVRLVVRVC